MLVLDLHARLVAAMMPRPSAAGYGRRRCILPSCSTRSSGLAHRLVTDLVEEQGAPFRLLEAARHARMGP